MIDSAEAARLQSMAQVGRFFELSIDLLAIAGYDGRYVRLNGAWEATLGWSKDLLLSKSYIEFVHPEDRDRTRQEARRIVESSGDCIRFENRYRCLDGSHRWLHWTARPFPQEGAIYAIARDITEQKEAQRALLESLARIDELTDLLPICAWCKKIKDSTGKWHRLDEYLKVITRSEFTHGICPDCQRGFLSEGSPLPRS